MEVGNLVGSCGHNLPKGPQLLGGRQGILNRGLLTLSVALGCSSDLLPSPSWQIKDLRDHKLDNRMESFFLAETVKYLYLLFDPNNFIHNNGSTFDAVITPYGECILGAGGYIFNTEAHPIDPAALHCCRRLKEEQWEVEDLMREFYSLKRNRSRFQKTTMSSGPWEPPAGPGTFSSPENHDEAREKKPAKQKIPLLSCPSQPFTSKLALLGQVFLDSS